MEEDRDRKIAELEFALAGVASRIREMEDEQTRAQASNLEDFGWVSFGADVDGEGDRLEVGDKRIVGGPGGSGGSASINHSWLPLSPVGSVTMQVGDGKWSRRNTDLEYDGLTVLNPSGDGTFEIVAVLTADSDNEPFRDPSGIEVRFLASGETFIEKAHYMRRLLEVTWAGGVITRIVRRTLSDIVDTCDTINISESEGSDEWIATDINPTTQVTTKMIVETRQDQSGDDYEVAVLYNRPTSRHQGSTDFHKWDGGTEVFRFAECPDEESSG